MKTLQAFWHWVDNEKPAAELYAEKAMDNLSGLAHDALIEAERLVCVRAGAGSVQVFDHATEEEHRAMRPALRDLSLSLCAALEHMHGQVEDDYLGKRYPARPDFQTHAADVPDNTFLRQNAGDHAPPPIVPQCAACCSAPCNGTHVGCNLKAYMAAHPNAGDHAPLNGAPFKLLSDSYVRGLFGQQRAVAEQLFKREYIGDWVTGVDLSAEDIERSKRLTEHQLNMGAIRSLADWLPEPRACDGPLTGKRVTQADLDRVNAQMRGDYGDIPSGSGWVKQQLLANMPGRVLGRTVMNDDGLKPLKPERGVNLAELGRLYGKVASTWDPGARALHVYTCIDLHGVESLRGLSPRAITIHGKDSDYYATVLSYLREVLMPMLVDCPIVDCPEGATLPSGW